jgi:hypothetical protein
MGDIKVLVVHMKNAPGERGKAKAYQVRQVLKAIEKMESRHESKE